MNAIIEMVDDNLEFGADVLTITEINYFSTDRHLNSSARGAKLV